MTQSDQPVVTSGIRDNYQRGKVGDFLRDKIKTGSQLSIVSAYFTIYAYEALKDKLDGIEHLQFLFGEPSFTLDPEKNEKKAFNITDQGLELVNHLQQKRVAVDCSEWIRQKVEIKSVVKSDFLHGKMYHIDNSGVIDAILGSSNFTVAGLGAGSKGNIELNLEVNDRRDLNDLKTWFNQIWADTALVKDVKQEVLNYLAQLYDDNPPDFIYYKTLYHIFEDYLTRLKDKDTPELQRQVTESEVWKMLFEFQKDGVKGAINKIQTYNGCILADSVGLGKTFEALAVIKYFELRNDRVLVLCPKKLRENWTIYQAQNNTELNPFLKDRFNYTVLSHTDLSREGGKTGDIDLAQINWGNYDLVVIDESHNFRNNTPGKKDEDGNVIRKSRYQRLMDEIIKQGVKTRVLMLSATPVNNNLKDLRNQIYFITGDEDNQLMESLGIQSVKNTLEAAQRSFTEWAKNNPDHKTKDLLEKLNSSFFKLLDGLTIARSRKHVQKYYKESVAKLGGFPTRLKPKAIYPKIDTLDRFMSYDMLFQEISNYRLSLFYPSGYLLPLFQSIYDKKVKNFRQVDRERFLIGMMRVNFLKRLESSVYSFHLTLERTVSKIDALIARIEKFRKMKSESVDFDDLFVEDEDDEELTDLQEELQVGKLKFRMDHLDIDRWIKDLKEDRARLQMLKISAEEINADRDAKLTELKQIIAEKVAHPSLDKQGKPCRKVLVFTAFADTAEYIYQNLMPWAKDEMGIHCAMVSGGSSENKATFGKNEFNQILTNFAPQSKHRDKMRSMRQDAEIDLLIATDCISEGQNLQDCDLLVNYDIHWNPVRVIQRFGRIDRIGSIHHAVQLVNFWPTKDLDQYITLKNRVEARMALVDVAATNEDNLLATDELEELIKDDLKYRDKQLKRLREEVLDLEDFNENVALTEFTLDDFRMELNRYIENNRQKLQEAPLGLYAVVPAENPDPRIAPGVIFCLRQKAGIEETQSVNPLQPYYLVYIRNDGVVRYTFTHPKQILEIYRELCAGQAEKISRMCDLFNDKTQNGADLEFYTGLLEQAVRAVTATYKKRNLAGLTQSSTALIPKLQDQINNTTDFELITWLVIL